jgi:hypothetical protein
MLLRQGAGRFFMVAMQGHHGHVWPGAQTGQVENIRPPPRSDHRHAMSASHEQPPAPI